MMRLRIKKPTRIKHKPGEIVEVSPDMAAFLLMVEAAELIEPERETPEAPAVKKTTRKK